MVSSIPAGSISDLVAARILVAFNVGLPVETLPEDLGRKGGRSRWWLCRVPSPSSQRSRGVMRTRRCTVSGFVEIPGDRFARTATAPCLFHAPVIPGCRYTLGVGAMTRIEIEIPEDATNGAVCSVDPTGTMDADVLWSTTPDQILVAIAVASRAVGGVR